MTGMGKVRSAGNAKLLAEIDPRDWHLPNPNQIF
jgi:hypothetical protein